MNVDTIFKEPAPKKPRLATNKSKIDEIVDSAVETVADQQSLKKLTLKLEKAISKNQTQRTKYPNDPLKYIDSETDLEEILKEFTAVSSYPQLYPTMIQLQVPITILSLLEHENTDISISCVNLLNELIDEEIQTSEEAVDNLQDFLQELLKNDVLGLLAKNLSRLNSEKLDDKEGIFNTLNLMENIVSIDPSESLNAFNSIHKWALGLIEMEEFDSVKQYCTEMFAILLQNSIQARLSLAKEGGLDIMLQQLAKYRKKDPRDGDELEMVENLFDIVSMVCQEADAKQLFVDAEGIELLLLMIKQQMFCRYRAIKVLDHLLTNCTPAIANHLVELGGLKHIFPLLNKKSATLKKSYPDYSQAEQDEHIVSIISFLFQSLTDESLLRLLYKFVENDYEKLHRILLISYESRAKVGDGEYVDRLDNGLYTVQMIDIILLYCLTLSSDIKAMLPDWLKELNYSFEGIKENLTEYLDYLEDPTSGENTKTKIRALLPNLE